MTTGEEFHASVPLGATGGEIEVLRVRPVGVSGPVVVEVRLMLDPAKIPLGVRGPLASDVVVLPPPSADNPLMVNTGGPDRIYSLDVRMIPTAAGLSRVTGVAVTYRAGPLRQRTARLNATICIYASASWQDHRDWPSSCDGGRN